MKCIYTHLKNIVVLSIFFFYVFAKNILISFWSDLFFRWIEYRWFNMYYCCCCWFIIDKSLPLFLRLRLLEVGASDLECTQLRWHRASILDVFIVTTAQAKLFFLFAAMWQQSVHFTCLTRGTMNGKTLSRAGRKWAVHHRALFMWVLCVSTAQWVGLMPGILFGHIEATTRPK